jgi:hypothetical protein
LPEQFFQMRAFRHIITLSLAGTLLVGQTGISLHHIYCYCKGQWESSFFAEEVSSCEEHDLAEAHPLPSCCEHNTDCSLNAPEDSHLPCKEDQTIYLQLDELAIPASIASLDQAVEWPATVAILPYFQLQYPSLDEAPLHPSFRAPPLLRSGQSILIWVQSFLC